MCVVNAWLERDCMTTGIKKHMQFMLRRDRHFKCFTLLFHMYVVTNKPSSFRQNVASNMRMHTHGHHTITMKISNLVIEDKIIHYITMISYNR